jgi:pyruvate, orthophosphate dikinase
MKRKKLLKKADFWQKVLMQVPGAASGRVALSAQDAEEMAAKGDPVILVRIETSPEDIKGMNASEGILNCKRRNDFARCSCCTSDG